jgi:hypothetical protein
MKSGLSNMTDNRSVRGQAKSRINACFCNSIIMVYFHPAKEKQTIRNSSRIRHIYTNV